jgi:hypothetical protein
MRSSERLLANIFRIIFRKYVRRFDERSPEGVLKKSLSMLDGEALIEVREYVRSKMHPAGGFVDKAGKPDLYYTLFGYFLSSALGQNDELFPTVKFVENEIRTRELDGIHFHCAAILASGLSDDRKLWKDIKHKLHKNLKNQLSRQPAYGAFITLLACWYLNDYRGLFQVRSHLNRLSENGTIPSTVIAALMVLRRSFNKPADDLKIKLPDFYGQDGGFKAVKNAPVADLLSTAVVLYAHYFNGDDLRLIKPECLNFVDSLYSDGGFGGNILDPEPDIEYTFYGLLALGSLAD